MTEEQLYYEILNMLGLEIIQGRIYDSDAGSFLIYNGGFYIRMILLLYIRKTLDLIRYTIINLQSIY